MGWSHNNSPRPPMRAGEGLGVRVGSPSALRSRIESIGAERSFQVLAVGVGGAPTLTPGPSPALMGGRGGKVAL